MAHWETETKASQPPHFTSTNVQADGSRCHSSRACLNATSITSFFACAVESLCSSILGDGKVSFHEKVSLFKYFCHILPLIGDVYELTLSQVPASSRPRSWQPSAASPRWPNKEWDSMGSVILTHEASTKDCMICLCGYRDNS